MDESSSGYLGAGLVEVRRMFKNVWNLKVAPVNNEMSLKMYFKVHAR